MSKSSKHVFFAVTVIIWGIVLLLCTCGTKKQADNIVLSIDVPSEDNIPMPTGRSFFVSGKISPAEPVPENAVLEVEMLDQTGKVLRHIAGTKKDPSKFYVYPEMTDSFCTDREQIQNSLNNFVRCEYLVDDPSAPDLSFRNAEIKCCIDGDTFWALIVGGTDEEHGAAVDDGCHFTAADGSPYNAPPVGEYILRVSLKDKNGEKLSTAEKPLVIGDSENALIMRFHPDRYLNYMTTEIRKLIDYQTNVDYIPGFLVGIDGNAGGRTLLFKANNMALYRNAHSYLQAYMIDPTSSSWTVEMPYLYYLDHVGNPEYFTTCYFDIGESSLNIEGKEIKGNIISFQPGDYHAICRIDTVEKGTEENVFDLTKQIAASSLKEPTGIIRFSPDDSFAVMGVLAPAKLEDSYIFDPEHNEFSITNRVEMLKYTFTSGDTEIRFEKPVYLHRENVEETAGNYDSVLEYYHVFDFGGFETDKAYQVVVKGYDKNSKEVNGTEERFSIEWSLDEF